MKKHILLITGGVMAISVITYFYYAFVYYPSLVNVSGITMPLTLGDYVLRPILYIVFGWWLASYNYKHMKKRKRDVFPQFMKKSWGVFVLIFAVFMLYNATDFRYEYYKAQYFVWDLLVNRNATSYETYLQYGVDYIHLPHFIIESFMTIFSHLSFALAFLAYQLRVSFSEPTEVGRTAAKTMPQQ